MRPLTSWTNLRKRGDYRSRQSVIKTAWRRGGRRVGVHGVTLSRMPSFIRLDVYVMICMVIQEHKCEACLSWFAS